MKTDPAGEAGRAGTLTRPQSRRAWRSIALALLLVALGAALLASHPDQARVAIRQVSRLPAWAPAAAFALVLVQLACQALRLWAVMPRRLAFGARAVLSDWTAGEWLNMFAPARGGDALKIVLLRRRRGEDPAALPETTGAVLADKVVDGIAVLLLCAAGGMLGMLWRAEARWYVLAGIALVLMALFIALRLKLAAGWMRSRQWLVDFTAGFAALRDPGRAATALLFALLAWVAEGIALWVLCAALGIVLTPPQVLLALLALNLAIGVPVALANLGVYEAALAAGLAQAGAPLPTAIALATVHHAIQLAALNAAALGVSYRSLTARS